MNTVFDTLTGSIQDKDIQFVIEHLQLNTVTNATIASINIHHYFPEYYINFSQFKNIQTDVTYRYNFDLIKTLEKTELLISILQQTNNFEKYYGADTDYERLAIITKSIIDLVDIH